MTNLEKKLKKNKISSKIQDRNEPYDWRKGRAVKGEVFEDSRPDEPDIIIDGFEETEEERQKWKEIYNRIHQRRIEYSDQGINSAFSPSMAYLNDPFLGPLISLWQDIESELISQNKEYQDGWKQMNKVYQDRRQRGGLVRCYFTKKVLEGKLIIPEDFAPHNHEGHINEVDVDSDVIHYVMYNHLPLLRIIEKHIPYVVLLDKRESNRAVRSFLTYVHQELGGWGNLRKSMEEELRQKSSNQQT